MANTSPLTGHRYHSIPDKFPATNLDSHSHGRPSRFVFAEAIVYASETNHRRGQMTCQPGYSRLVCTASSFFQPLVVESHLDDTQVCITQIVDVGPVCMLVGISKCPTA